MSLTVVACMCGSSESRARNFLKHAGYPDWMSIRIYRGKEKSLSALNQLPATREKEDLKAFLNTASKWVVIIGYDPYNVSWSDITHNVPKSTIEAEYIVKNFS